MPLGASKICRLSSASVISSWLFFNQDPLNAKGWNLSPSTSSKENLDPVVINKGIKMFKFLDKKIISKTTFVCTSLSKVSYQEAVKLNLHKMTLRWSFLFRFSDRGAIRKKTDAHIRGSLNKSIHSFRVFLTALD